MLTYEKKILFIKFIYVYDLYAELQHSNSYCDQIECKRKFSTGRSIIKNKWLNKCYIFSMIHILRNTS